MSVAHRKRDGARWAAYMDNALPVPIIKPVPIADPIATVLLV
jgi:hypothetical protein